jgi:hypothetical protein
MLAGCVRRKRGTVFTVDDDMHALLRRMHRLSSSRRQVANGESTAGVYERVVSRDEQVTLTEHARAL